MMCELLLKNCAIVGNLQLHSFIQHWSNQVEARVLSVSCGRVKFHPFIKLQTAPGYCFSVAESICHIG